MLVLVINGKKLPFQKELINLIKNKFINIVSLQICFNTKKTNVVLTNDLNLLYGKKYIKTKLKNLQYFVEPTTFFQINYEQTENLYSFVKKIIKDLSNNKKITVFDLYSGVGSISIFIADSVKKIIAIENNPDSSALAEKNIKLNRIDNILNICGDVEKNIEKIIENNHNPDLIIFDPPRKGIEKEALEKFLKLKTLNIIYISCNPATLARDTKIILQHNYKIELIQPFDMFPQTYHIETLILFKLKF
jgi:23S rRNA (uracil1939-C5)-methyltransferase